MINANITYIQENKKNNSKLIHVLLVGVHKKMYIFPINENFSRLLAYQTLLWFCAQHFKRRCYNIYSDNNTTSKESMQFYRS